MPGFVDPYKMAKNRQALQGELAVASMPRANQMLESKDGVVNYSLLFDMDKESLCFVEGQIHTKVSVRCQRCLQIFLKEINGSFKVSPVKTDSAAKALSSEYEPLIVTEDKLYPAELVEDELILAIPLAPMHEEICVDSAEIKEQDLVNPFQVLQELKVNKKGHKAGDK
jgi:uncharacterized protein